MIYLIFGRKVAVASFFELAGMTDDQYSGKG